MEATREQFISSKELDKSMCLSIEDIREWLPLGQKVLKAGYKKISQQEIFNMIAPSGYWEAHDNGLCWILLDHYTNDVIPEKALNEIRLARSIGIEKFRVYWYEKDVKTDDPIVTALLGQLEYYITKW